MRVRLRRRRGGLHTERIALAPSGTWLGLGLGLGLALALGLGLGLGLALTLTLTSAVGHQLGAARILCEVPHADVAVTIS